MTDKSLKKGRERKRWSTNVPGRSLLRHLELRAPPTELLDQRAVAIALLVQLIDDHLLALLRLRSLPAVPPREGLMNDRYKSLQARNLIEPRKMAGKNKTRKMNSVTKNSAKDLKYTSPHSKWNTSKDTKYTSGMELPSWM